MPIFANPDPIFQPAMRIVTAVTNGFPCEVTTSFDHDYIDGTIVRLYVPEGYGMVGANQKYGPITVTGTTTFTIPIDTTFFDAFVVPPIVPGVSYQLAQCTAIGEINAILTAAEQNVLP
jgi:hypothetical protein